MDRDKDLVSIDYVLNNFENLYGCDDWNGVIEYMLKNDSIVIERLRGELKRVGYFREPIILKDGHVADGTHRLVSHILEGSEKVFVSNDYSPFAGSLKSLSTEITLKEDVTEETIDYFESKIGSINVSDDVWISTSVIFSSKDKVEFIWEQGFFEDITKHIEEIDQFLKRVLKEDNVEVTTRVFDPDKDD